MADEATVDRLAIEVVATDDEAIKKINGLASALESLKTVTANMGDMGKAFEGLKGISSELSASTESIKGISTAFESLKGIGTIDISLPENIGETIANLNEAVSGLQADKVENIVKLADSLTSLNEVKEISLPKELPEQLKGLAETVSGIEASNGESVGKLADSLSKLSSVGGGEIKSFIQEFARLPQVADSLASVDINRLTEQIKALSAAMAPLAEKMKDIGSGMSAFNEKLPKIDTKGLESEAKKEKKKTPFQDILKYTRERKEQKGEKEKIDTGDLDAQTEKVKAFEKALNALATGMDFVANAVDSGKTMLESLGPVLDTLSMQIKQFVMSIPVIGPALVIIGEAINLIIKASGGLKKFISNVTADMRNFLAVLKDVAQNGLNKVADGLSNFTSGVFSGFTNGIKSVGENLVTRFTKPFTNAIKKFNEWKGALGRVAFYRAVREAIKRVTDGFKEGIENLYQYSRMVGTEFAPAMDKLATSSLYLKNSLGAISAPLIQAIAPVVDALIDKFVALLNIIGKVFAVLTGKSVYTQAKKHVTEYGDAVSGAAKATQSFLLGIDELNVIEESAGGGGGAGADFGDMFEEVEIGEEFDWARQMREALENEQWEEAGVILAKKLNEVIENLDTKAWGEELGKKINAGLKFAVGFVNTFEFEELGRKLGGAVLGLMDGIGLEGFENIGALLASGWNGVFKTLEGVLDEWEPRVEDMGASIAAIINGWIDNIDWEGNADTLSRGIIFLGDLARETFEKIKWEELGDGVARALNNIKWYEIIMSVSGAIKAGIDGLKKAIDAFLAKWDWKDTAKQIYDGINDSIKDIDAKGWGETLGKAISTAIKFLATILWKIDWEMIGNKIGDFLVEMNWPEILGDLADAILAGISAAFKLLKGLIDTIHPHIKEAAEELGHKIGEAVKKIDAKEWGQTLNTLINDALEFLITFMDTMQSDGTFDEIGRKIGEFFEQIEWQEILGKIGTLIGQALFAKESIVEESGVIDVGMQLIAGLGEGIWNEFQASGGIMGWLKRAFFDSFMDGIRGLFGVHSPSTVFEEIGGFLIAGLEIGIGAFQGVIDFFSGGIADIIKIFTEGWASIQEDTNIKWENIGKDVDGKVKKMTEDTNLDIEGLKEKLSGHTTEISDDFSTKIEGIQTDSKEKWEGISKDTNDKVEEIKTNVSNGYETVSTDTQGKLEGIRDDSAKKWFSISKETNDKIEDVKKNVSNGYEKVRTDVTTKMGQTSTESDEKWEEIRSTTKTKVDNVNTEVDTGFEKVKTTINSKLDDAKREANQKDWTDVGKNVVDGISSGIARNQGKLEKQMSSTMLAAKKAAERAAGIASPSKLFRDDVGWFIGLGIAAGIDDSEPEVVSSISDMTNAMEKEVGNLHISMNLDTGNMKNDIANSFEGIKDYTNNLGLDIGNGMAEGIKNSENEVLNALSSLNDDMQNELSDLSYSIKGNASDFEFPKPEDAYANYKVSYKEQDDRRNGEQDNSIDITDGMRNANQEVVTALYAVATQIVNAVNDIDMKPVVTIGKKDITRAVEETQRQRGANIMAGGVRS